MSVRRALIQSFIVTLVIMYFVPLPVYGLISVLWGLEPPGDGSPASFMLAVLVMKVGVSLGFVMIFYLARDAFGGNWRPYALVWFAMFALTEAGQAIGPGYSWMEAIGGIISEAIYFPLSAFLVDRIVGRIWVEDR
jgi:hypothetical protein